MALAALGAVYGDIGTSPLYTFKTAIAWAGGEATPAAALGMLSLIVWTLIITTSNQIRRDCDARRQRR
jgi:KUP system potassium uptake protein